MATEMKPLQLIKRWENLFPLPQMNHSPRDAFDQLSAKYGEKHRAYHTLQHVSTCLTLLETVQANINDLQSVELAIWFHDVIYSPRRNDNEEQSAAYASEVLTIFGARADVIKNVNHLILLTKHPSSPATEDEKFIVDIDLSVLGGQPAAYDHYSNLIRKEYVHVPSVLYAAGRKRVLRSFLDSDYIFHTAHFRSANEAQARKNIKRELQQLTWWKRPGA